METYQYERVTYEQHIPAMIAVLDQRQIKQYFPLDIFIPSHWHRSLEISLIEHAEICLQIGTKEYLIENDFTCVNSGIVHALQARELKDDPRCIILLISYEFMKEYYPNIDNVYFDLSLQKDHGQLKQLYYRLRDLYEHQSTFTYLDITACILEIFKLLLTDYCVDKKHNGKNSVKHQDQIKTILTYLHEHYMEDLTLLDMADKFHVSKEYFSRQFHQYVGKTFRDYITSYRLYKAYDDVINSTSTIQDIASKHGFRNVRSFIKAFHDSYHETPLKYRKCQ